MPTIYPHVSFEHKEPEAVVRGTKEVEPRATNGYYPYVRPNTDLRHKAYTIEQLRIASAMRTEAAKEGKLLPALPCPYKICAACDKLRAFWDEALLPNKKLINS